MLEDSTITPTTTTTTISILQILRKSLDGLTSYLHTSCVCIMAFHPSINEYIMTISDNAWGLYVKNISITLWHWETPEQESEAASFWMFPLQLTT